MKTIANAVATAARLVSIAAHAALIVVVVGLGNPYACLVALAGLAYTVAFH